MALSATFSRLSRARRALERGAVAPLIAIVFPVLLLAAALSVDIGMLLTTKAALQRAVDAAALSAAEIMGEIPDDAAAQVAARRVARQVLAANNVPTASLAEPVEVTFPADKGNAVSVLAQLRSPSYLLRAVSPITEFTVAARATADVNSYAEVPIKPSGNFGKIQQMNPAVFGPDAWRSRGDVYSVDQQCSNETAGSGCVANPEYAELPYGYLFRIDVPPDYENSQLTVQLFDPDTWNSSTTVGGYAGCGGVWDPCIQTNFYGGGWHRFHRVDELRTPIGDPDGGDSSCDFGGAGSDPCSGYSATTQFTLWHFDPLITNPFQNPSTLSDQSGGAYIARVEYGYDATTDLRWIAPSGFTLTLSNYDEEREGGWYFYLYVRTTAGSGENNFDIRSGPPGQTIEPTVNEQQSYTWDSDGSSVYAKRAYPMNNAGNAAGLTVYMTQVPANAAGQQLRVRHFDNDCSSGCAFDYFLGGVDVGNGVVSGGNTWGQTDIVTIPEKGTSAYDTIFPPGTESAWLTAAYPATISQDTSVWELIYIRPRLIQ